MMPVVFNLHLCHILLTWLELLHKRFLLELIPEVSIPRLDLLLFKIEVTRLVIQASAKPDSMVAESRVLLLPQLFNLFFLTLLLDVINDLELGVLTDNESLGR